MIELKELGLKKTNKLYLFIIFLYLILFIVGVTTFIFKTRISSFKYERLSYQGKKYYSTALLEANHNDNISQNSSNSEFYNAKIIGHISDSKKSMKKANIWKLDAFSQNKLIIESNKITYIVWTNKNFKHPIEALNFLSPKSLCSRVYTNNGKDSSLKKLNKSKQKQLIKAVRENLRKKAHRGNGNVINYQNKSTYELYLYNNETQALGMRVSLSKDNQNHNYLTILGDNCNEYWKADAALLSLLKE